jgi:hypothetical protein
MTALIAILVLLYIIGLVYTVIVLPTMAEKIIIGFCVAIFFGYAIIAGVICTMELLVRAGEALGKLNP